VAKNRRSLGRDPFDDEGTGKESSSVEKLIKGKAPGARAPEAREVSVTVKLTPSNIKHLDAIRHQLQARGKSLSRNELIRIAISLLTVDEVG
jgi:hypothetical protein